MICNHYPIGVLGEPVKHSKHSLLSLWHMFQSVMEGLRIKKYQTLNVLPSNARKYVTLQVTLVNSLYSILFIRFNNIKFHKIPLWPARKLVLSNMQKQFEALSDYTCYC